MNSFDIPESFELPDVGGVDFDFDLDGFDIDLSSVDSLQNERYRSPKIKSTKPAAFKNAMQLASRVELKEGASTFCLVSGNFIFGDFIEAMTRLDKWRIERITIHTLTMSQNTIDSLDNVLIMDQPSELHIIMSDYWYAHERGRKNGLLGELYEKLDIGDGFRLAFCRTHAKICTILTKAGHKVVIHGSANMRSHGVIEQFQVDCDSGLYDFVEGFNDKVLDEYDIINRGAKAMRPVGQSSMYDMARRQNV